MYALTAVVVSVPRVTMCLDRFIVFFQQNAMDDQIQQVKSGRELANLDRVPNPNLVVPPQLRVPMPMMRPRFVPMMPVRGGPMPAVPGGLMVDPGAFGGPGPRGVPVPMPVVCHADVNSIVHVQISSTMYSVLSVVSQ